MLRDHFIPKGQRPWYWISALLLVVLGVLGSQDAGEWLLVERFWFYQQLQRLDWRRPQPSITRLVVISDDEFWSEELAGRTPLNRHYLSRLLDAVARERPTVIALDIRMPSYQAGKDFSPYQDEDRDLLCAISRAAVYSKIVLPSGLSFDRGLRGWVEAPTIYSGRLPVSPRITRGYLELIDDVRAVPIRVRLIGGQSLDSLSQAIVRAYGLSKVTDTWTSDQAPFGSFSSASEFEDHVLRSSQVLRGRAGSLGLEGKIVLIGGSWRSLGPGKGRPVDVWTTPAGDLPGIYLHANYVESFIGAGLRRRLARPLEGGVEVLFSLALATALVWKRRRFRRDIYPVLGLSVLLLLFSYLLMMNLGFFFDFVIPVFIVILHWLYHEIKELREKAELYDVGRQELSTQPPRGIAE